MQQRERPREHRIATVKATKRAEDRNSESDHESRGSQQRDHEEESKGAEIRALFQLENDRETHN